MTEPGGPLLPARHRLALRLAPQALTSLPSRSGRNVGRGCRRDCLAGGLLGPAAGAGGGPVSEDGNHPVDARLAPARRVAGM